MSRENKLFHALQVFHPDELYIENESHLHGFSRGEDSHFKVLIVSYQFEGLGRVERHQKINEVFKEEFEKGLHALTLRALTPDEFKKIKPEDFKSPQCAHQSRSGDSHSD